MAADVEPSSGIRLSAHPRARRHIAAAKTWGGLAAFVFVAVLSHRAELPLGDLLLRSMLAGVGGYLVGWVLALVAWRQIALAQIEDLRRTLVAEAEERRRQLEAERERLEQEAAARAQAAR